MPQADGVGGLNKKRRTAVGAAKQARLRADFREQILSFEAQPGRSPRYGQKYEILKPLKGPNGTTAWVCTIWIIRTGETAPRLVTLIPAEKP